MLSVVSSRANLARHSSWADLLIALLIFAFTFALFLRSPVFQEADSSYSMLVSQSLIDYGTFKLDNYAIPREEPVYGIHGNYFGLKSIYHIEVVGGHLYYYFPPGTSVLSVPYVALANRFGIYPTNPDGTYNPAGEYRIETGLAALLMAALAVVFYFTARLLLPKSWSVVVAMTGALGTQVWSTASRAMWSETWGILLLGLALWMILAAETGRRRLSPELLATFLAWTYFVRPTNAITILAVAVYVLLFYRTLFLRFAVSGAIWLAGFLFYSWHNFGHLLPSYYAANRLSFRYFWMALGANLFSPSRGVLIYLPWLLFVVYLLVSFRRYREHRRLIILSLPVMLAHLFVMSSYDHWWGGYSYGPRFMTSLVPWFVLLAVLAVRAWLRWREENRAVDTRRSFRVQVAAGCVLLVLSIF